MTAVFSIHFHSVTLTVFTFSKAHIALATFRPWFGSAHHNVVGGVLSHNDVGQSSFSY